MKQNIHYQDNRRKSRIKKLLKSLFESNDSIDKANLIKNLSHFIEDEGVRERIEWFYKREKDILLKNLYEKVLSKELFADNEKRKNRHGDEKAREERKQKVQQKIRATLKELQKEDEAQTKEDLVNSIKFYNRKP